jgi:hypothetical protein
VRVREDNGVEGGQLVWTKRGGDDRRGPIVIGPS